MYRISLFFFFLLLSVQASAQLIINEVCYDPSNVGLQGDANGDGVYDQTQDEFIEFINTGTSDLNISRYRICDRVLATGLKTVRHTVAMGTIIPPGGAFVVFGGGSAVGNFGGAVVRVDLGTQGLSLGNSGESVLLEDSSGNFLDSLNTDALSDNPNESYTRNPDITGSYVQHGTVTPSVLFSPGTKVDGTPFNTVLSVQADSAIQHFSLWPNPANDIVKYSMEQGEKSCFQIWDASGKQRDSFWSTSGVIDIRKYQNGIYLVCATKGEKSWYSKLVIAR